MDDDEIQDELADIAESYDKDLDDVQALYDEKLAHMEEVDVVGIEEDDYPRAALSTVQSQLLSESRSGGPQGEAVEIPILAVGNFGVFDSWGKDDDTVMVGVGIAAPDDTSSENRPAGPAVFILKESQGLDIGKCRDLWQWGNHLRGWFTVEKLKESFAGRKRTYYVCGSTDRSKVEEADFSGSLPSSNADVQKLLADTYFPETFELETVADNLSMEGEEFGANWLDLRRFQGQVVDYYRRLPEDCEPDQNPFGKYVLIDQAGASPEELESNRDLVTDDDVENGRTPGLQVFIPPEAVQYGNGSTVEVYGTLTRNSNTGQITMRAAGVAPMIPYPLDEEDEGGDHDDAEQEAL